MANVKILIVEDELLIAEDIRMQLEILGYEVSGMAVSYNEALECIMQELPDLVLVDITIEGAKDGIELGKFLREEVDLPFIYLTSHADKVTVARAKETQPDAYLLKPFKSANLFTSIEMALATASSNHIKEDSDEAKDDFILKDCLFVKKDNAFIKIKLDEIKYLKSEGNYLTIFINSKEKYQIRSSIRNFIENLPEDIFFQTHKSYIINLKHLDQFSYTNVTIEGEEIPLSKSKRDLLFSKMKTF
ncbi:MAG: response regulator [Salinivirgaceae bacterium]|nr:response regulator [Salinivirgaceae bacterium]